MVENCVAVEKEYQWIANRYCQLERMYATTLCLVAAVVAMRERETGQNPGGRLEVNRHMPI